MKKFLFVTLLFFGMESFCQTIPNSGFENWLNNGPFLTPANWVCTNNIIQSGNSHTGNFSIELAVDTMTNPQSGNVDTIAASAYTGEQPMGPPNPGPGASLGGYAFSERPDSITGWIKFTSVLGDMYRINVQLSKWDTALETRVIIASGLYSNNFSIDSFSRFTTPLLYSSSDLPDTAVIKLEVADMMFRHIGTSLLVDDLAFTFSDASVKHIEQDYSIIRVFPNPTNGEINIFTNLPDEMNFEATIFNAYGKLVVKIANSKNIDISGFANGIYFIEIISDNKILCTQKIILSK